MKLGRLPKNNSYEDPCIPPWFIGEKRRGELWAKDMQ
jgi:hypothetical protein